MRRSVPCRHGCHHRRGYDPDYEAALIQSVFDVAHAARYRTETIPLPPTVLGRNKAVDQLAVCHG